MKIGLIAISTSLLLISGASLAQGEQKTAVPPATSPQNADKSTSTMPGKMTPEQQKMSMQEYAKLDANKDGKLSMTEAKLMPALSTDFGKLDMDKDGSLSMTEFSMHHMK
jgi:hypothetical protein